MDKLRLRSGSCCPSSSKAGCLFEGIAVSYYLMDDRRVLLSGEITKYDRLRLSKGKNVKRPNK
eukprot:scaffold3167_cov132-Skeletonema_dohrnii-CCMP3373.AAC.4